MIEYKDIPKYCDHIDKDKRSAVVLSKNQAWLYRRLTEDRLKPLLGMARLLDMLIYSGVLLCVLVFARNLLLLSYFRRHNDACADLVQFQELDNGRVTVTFNPLAEPNTVECPAA